MDDIDRKLLDLLEINGRETVSALAGKIGLSRTSTQERLSKLEQTGEIAGYTIKRKTPAPEQQVKAYLLITTNGALCHQLAPHLEKWPEVKTFDSISGETDAVLYIETKTNAKLGELRDKIATFHQVKSIKTLNILQTRIKR